MTFTKVHATEHGAYYLGDAVELLKAEIGEAIKGKVQLILTSPPFPLNNKKSYGNLTGDRYRQWFADLAPMFADLLCEEGSIVIELGNAWEPERPVQSLLPLKSLMDFVENPNAGLNLCQEFVCYNPARLPSPAQWVTVDRIRVTDSYTHVWWMAKTDYPKADNRRVLRPYSESMKRLLKRQSYNDGKRPSEHHISSDSFAKDHGGSIAHNLFEIEQMDENRKVRLPNAFSFSNTVSNDYFMRACRDKGIKPHPARMPKGLAAFFIQFLTEPGDLVFDPFAGSNTTGYVSELLDRHWISSEIVDSYAVQSKLRFEDPQILEKVTGSVREEQPWNLQLL